VPLYTAALVHRGISTRPERVASLIPDTKTSSRTPIPRIRPNPKNAALDLESTATPPTSPNRRTASAAEAVDEDKVVDDWEKCMQEITEPEASSSSAGGATTSTYTPIASIAEQVDAYMRLPLIPRTSDPLLFWKKEKKLFPTLSKLARKYLGTPSSSVYSERMFSEMGNIYDEKRNRLLPRNSEKLLFLHHNIC
jgi:hypothetical protein